MNKHKHHNETKIFTEKPSILSHTGSPEHTDVSGRIHTETQQNRMLETSRQSDTLVENNNHIFLFHYWHLKCQTFPE